MEADRQQDESDAAAAKDKGPTSSTDAGAAADASQTSSKGEEQPPHDKNR